MKFCHHSRNHANLGRFRSFYEDIKDRDVPIMHASATCWDITPMPKECLDIIADEECPRGRATTTNTASSRPADWTASIPLRPEAVNWTRKTV